jgi:hypothetical protein
VYKKNTKIKVLLLNKMLGQEGGWALPDVMAGPVGENAADGAEEHARPAARGTPF